MKKELLFLPVALGILVACGDEDTEAPTMMVESIYPTPMADSICGSLEDQVVTLNGGDTIRVELHLTDNKELGQLKVDIHNNFDCHGHDGKTATTDWEVLDVTELTGTTQHVTLEYVAPADITAGAYHFDVELIDAAGNEAAEQEIFDLKAE
jgi:hypothetical protein